MSARKVIMVWVNVENETMTQKLNTIIIGAGQAGLAASYYLKQHHIKHLILEKDEVASTWINKRWDSFTLVTPNWMNKLPDAPVIDNDPNGFLSREQVVQYLKNYAKYIQAPVQEKTEVFSVKPNGAGFLVSTSQGSFEAEHVIVATSIFNKPYMPAISKQIPLSIHQLHSEDYKNPEALSAGAILVIGSAQSGAQIAEELLEAGRKTYLATSKAGRMPRRYRGKDSGEWMELLGALHNPAVSVSQNNGRFPANGHLSGKQGGHTINLWNLQLRGLELLGTFSGYDHGQFHFKNNILEHLKYADTVAETFHNNIDAYIFKNNLEILTEKIESHVHDVPVIETLDLKGSEITTIIWATGYRFDYAWIACDTFDEYGYPASQQGVSKQPGLYFVGLHGTHKSTSGLLYGVSEVAKHVVDDIANEEHL